MEGNKAVADIILNSQKSNSFKTAFISILKQRDQFEQYSPHLVEYGFQDSEFLEITNELTSQDLTEFDILYLHGGDPFKTLQQIRSSGFYRLLQDFYKSQKLIITTSGSSMVLAKDISILLAFYPKSKKKSSDDMIGLNLFPHVVLPHFDRYEKKRGLEIIKVESKTDKIYALYDGSAIVYHDNKIEIIENAVIYENGLETAC